jgi:hypothetical protein
MKITIVSSSSGDWEGLYIDGVLKLEEHRISNEDLLKAAGVVAESFEAAEGWVEDRGSLPELLSDVVLHPRYAKSKKKK